MPTDRERVEQAFIDGSMEGSPVDRDGNPRAPASEREAARRGPAPLLSEDAERALDELVKWYPDAGIAAGLVTRIRSAAAPSPDTGEPPSETRLFERADAASEFYEAVTAYLDPENQHTHSRQHAMEEAERRLRAALLDEAPAGEPESAT